MTIPQLKVIQGGKKDVAKHQPLNTWLNISSFRYIPPGALITSQVVADNLPFNITRIYRKT